jgi:hypothetical protein
MTPRAVRKSERAVHLVWGVVLGLYVYGLLPSWGEPLVRWVVIPGAVASGFAMWFAAPLRRLMRSMAPVSRPEPDHVRSSSTPGS